MTNINSEELAKSVGKAIGRQRQQAGLTQEQVAEHLKIGMEAVSRMERGLVVPTVVRLAELAQLFECELADFLRETSNRPTEPRHCAQPTVGQARYSGQRAGVGGG